MVPGVAGCGRRDEELGPKCVGARWSGRPDLTLRVLPTSLGCRRGQRLPGSGWSRETPVPPEELVSMVPVAPCPTDSSARPPLPLAEARMRACEGGTSRQRAGRRCFPGQRHTLGCLHFLTQDQASPSICPWSAPAPGVLTGTISSSPEAVPPNPHRCVPITTSVFGVRPPQVWPGAVPVLRRPEEPLSILYHPATSFTANFKGLTGGPSGIYLKHPLPLK